MTSYDYTVGSYWRGMFGIWEPSEFPRHSTPIFIWVWFSVCLFSKELQLMQTKTTWWDTTNVAQREGHHTLRAVGCRFDLNPGLLTANMGIPAQLRRGGGPTNSTFAFVRTVATYTGYLYIQVILLYILSVFSLSWMATSQLNQVSCLN